MHLWNAGRCLVRKDAAAGWVHQALLRWLSRPLLVESEGASGQLQTQAPHQLPHAMLSTPDSPPEGVAGVAAGSV